MLSLAGLGWPVALGELGFSFSQSMNGFEEGIEFLPANNAKKVEKRGPRRWVVLLALLVGCLLLALAVGLLVWWHLQSEWVWVWVCGVLVCVTGGLVWHLQMIDLQCAASSGHTQPCPGLAWREGIGLGFGAGASGQNCAGLRAPPSRSSSIQAATVELFPSPNLPLQSSPSDPLSGPTPTGSSAPTSLTSPP